MARRALDVGPIGQNVAANLPTIRKARGLSTRALADRTHKAGRRIPASGITRIEKMQRHVDVDDLVTLAAVLDVTMD